MLRALAGIARAEKLSELELRRGSLRVRLKAPSAAPYPPGATQIARLPGSDDASADAASVSAPGAVDTAGAEPGDNAALAFVVSPLVGIFYRAPSPQDPPFVDIGDRVEAGQVLAYVETMKVFNDIVCEVEGTVIEIAFENGQLVETGDRLMVIRRA